MNGRRMSRHVGAGIAILTMTALAFMVPGSMPMASAGYSPKCFGVMATIIGHAGAERIDGTSENDVIVGLRGNDIITGGDGDDLICGGNGADTIDGGAGTIASRGVQVGTSSRALTVTTISPAALGMTR